MIDQFKNANHSETPNKKDSATREAIEKEGLITSCFNLKIYTNSLNFEF